MSNITTTPRHVREIDVAVSNDPRETCDVRPTPLLSVELESVADEIANTYVSETPELITGLSKVEADAATKHIHKSGTLHIDDDTVVAILVPDDQGRVVTLPLELGLFVYEDIDREYLSAHGVCAKSIFDDGNSLSLSSDVWSFVDQYVTRNRVDLGMAGCSVPWIGRERRHRVISEIALAVQRRIERLNCWNLSFEYTDITDTTHRQRLLLSEDKGVHKT